METIGSKADLLRGYPEISAYSESLKIDGLGALRLSLLTQGLLLYRAFRGWTGQTKAFEREIDERLAPHRGHQMRSLGKNLPRQGQFYLNDDEIREFERTGYVPPFTVLDPAEAAELARYATRQHEEGVFDRNTYLTPEIIEAFRETGDWSINYSGLYQALREERFRSLLCRPQVTHRLASLLGEDVLCWRSQFFQKKPGSNGTFWHQNSVFRETGKGQKLAPTIPTDPGIIQLTCWIALTDVTKENGAMRIIPGSFENSSTEFLYSFIQDNLPRFVASLSKDQMRTLLRIAKYSGGSFFKAQAVFDAIYDRVKDGLLGKPIVDLEMKAGQAVIFSSLNMHGSFPNVTQDDTRLAFAGRFCNASVKVYDGMTHDHFSTTKGLLPVPVDRFAALLVHGQDPYGYNNIAGVDETAEALSKDGSPAIA